MKRLIIILLVIVLLCSIIDITAATDIVSNNLVVTGVEESPAPETSNPPVESDPPSDPDPPKEDETVGEIVKVDYTITLSNLYQYSMVALSNATLNGHVRGSIWVGGTLYAGEYKFVDDGSLGGTSSSTSYIANNDRVRHSVSHCAEHRAGTPTGTVPLSP